MNTIEEKRRAAIERMKHEGIRRLTDYRVQKLSEPLPDHPWNKLQDIRTIPQFLFKRV